MLFVWVFFKKERKIQGSIEPLSKAVWYVLLREDTIADIKGFSVAAVIPASPG